MYYFFQHSSNLSVVTFIKYAYLKELLTTHISTISILDLMIRIKYVSRCHDRLCGLMVRGLGYRSGGPGSIPGTTRKKNVVGLERGALSLVSTIEELLDRKVAAPV
jgi:hypothetical protein